MFREAKARILRYFSRSWGAFGGSWGPSGALLAALGPLLGLILGLLPPPGAHFWPPGASWGSFLASWRLLGFIFGLLGPVPVHFGPMFGSLFELFGVHRSIFHQAVENTDRNHWSKDLSKTVENTVRNTRQKVFRDHCRPETQKAMARWPVWGAHAPTGSGHRAFRLKGRPWSEANFGRQKSLRKSSVLSTYRW